MIGGEVPAVMLVLAVCNPGRGLKFRRGLKLIPAFMGYRSLKFWCLLASGGKDSGHSLSHAQVDILVDTVLRNHPEEVHQYRSSEKKELIVFYIRTRNSYFFLSSNFLFSSSLWAMGICKRKAEPSMFDMVLREKLDEITLAITKGNVQREGTKNGGNVSP
ncbi:hypothetical protein Cgig2_001290 [Carnegiea gigantea]|uniref:Uncharacterized protein n=1 Tax=Carnegiea gigantea TaxID=171969 RepID=A0A9Q1KMG8_9CARY|nr:hypothetical protein Cgig2_001290 [Carnegiea gigantea]